MESISSLAQELSGLLTALAAVVAGLLGVFKYFKYRSRRDEIRLVRETFDSVVRSLASEIEVERLAAAILLRRFLDPETELGATGLPYWREAVDVAAAILRGEETGNFQKLLADGLAFAPSLERADLQKTNLQFAYLGSRKTEAGEDVETDLARADFYRADLSRASLKGARAPGAAFYQARLRETVFKKADLRAANFHEADLGGALLAGALLGGADFSTARNLPPGLERHLDEGGVFRGTEPFEPPSRSPSEAQIRVFVSRPGRLDPRRDEIASSVLSMLEAEKMLYETISRSEYPEFGALAEVHRRMAGCSGAVILGFEQLVVRHGAWRQGTPEEERLRDARFPTPWNQVEAGMAATLGLPVLLIRENEVAGGVFDIGPSEPQVYRATFESLQGSAFREVFDEWCSHVRERSRTS